MKFIAAALPLGLAAMASAAPTTRSTSTGRVINVVDALLEIAPGAASCANPKYPGECSTAEQVAPKFVESLLIYGMHEINQIAALASLLALETGDFKANTNHVSGDVKFPEPEGRPGQGTANMQSAKFNLEFIKTLPEIGDEYANIPSVDGMTEPQLREMVNKINEAGRTFQTGAWFFYTHCKQEVKDLLVADADAGFTAYMAECVGTDATATDRLEKWELAKAAFGVVA